MDRAWQGRTPLERHAGSELLRHLLTLYSTCKLSAKDFSIACYWADLAGTQGGAFKRYGVTPDSSSGNFQKHLDTALPDDTPLFDVAVPLMYGKSEHRAITKLPMSAFWQTLEAELEADPTTMSILELSRPAPAERDGHSCIQ